jgi:hypothetical protein
MRERHGTEGVDGCLGLLFICHYLLTHWFVKAYRDHSAAYPIYPSSTFAATQICQPAGIPKERAVKNAPLTRSTTRSMENHCCSLRVFAEWHGVQAELRLLQSRRRSGRTRIGMMWSTSVAIIPRQCVRISQIGSARNFAMRRRRQSPSYPRSMVVPRALSARRMCSRHRPRYSARFGHG